MPAKAGFWYVFFIIVIVSQLSCKTGDVVISRKTARPWKAFREHPVMASSHSGVYIKEVGKDKPLLAFQANKRFIPGSTVKILTAYLALQAGQDTMVTALAAAQNNHHLCIRPLMDPGFLHPDFDKHALLDSLAQYDTLTFLTRDVERYGPGWAWEDFDRAFMPEMSVFPMYGNVVAVSGKPDSFDVYPAYFRDSVQAERQPFRRAVSGNRFYIPGLSANQTLLIPFIPDRLTLEGLLADTLGHKVIRWEEKCQIEPAHEIKGQPMDTLLKRMMARCDNFFADHILHHLAARLNRKGKVTDWFALHLPPLQDEPVLVDGSGLSRYNQISPADLCRVLEHQWHEAGEDKINTLYTNGYDPALKNEFLPLGKNILAKTGSMRGVFCLGGYVKTKRGRVLTFSVMINQHRTDTATCRTLVSNLLQQVYQAY